MRRATHATSCKGLVGEFRTNPKRFWTFVKWFKHAKGLLPTLLSGGGPVHDDVGKAHLLNRTFASKFSDPVVAAFPNVPLSVETRLSVFGVSKEVVRRLLRELSVSKACGLDGLSARIICECADELAAPLSELFNISLSSGVFPEQWSEANIVTIFKKGAGNDPANYR